MTTPQVPANALEVSDIRDEINPGDGSGIQQDVGANNSVRQLAGTAAKSVAGSEILFSDLSNKVAFSEIIAVSTSNTQGGVATEDNPITSQLTLQANSDMYEPTINWSYVLNSGSQDVSAADLVITKPTNKSALVKLTSLSGTKVANLTVTGVMTVAGHTINTCTKDILLTVNAVNTAFQVTATPSFTVNASGVTAQTAAITVTATSNTSLTGVTYRFTPTFVSGTGPLSPIINSDNVIFTATAAAPLVNSAVYSLLTEMFQNNIKIRANTSIVDIRAQFIDRQITSLTPTALSNNQFSNSASQYSTIDITAVHNSVSPEFAQGTITFTLETTGDTVTQQTLSSNTSAKVERISLYHDKDVSGFGFKKASVVVVATLRSPDNIIMDQKRSEPITLRAGTYGLTLNKPPSNTQIGFSAQTATSVGSAIIGAGNFAWSARQFNGSGPTLVVTDPSDFLNPTKTSVVNISATTPSGKNASQTISNTCNYDLTATLTYDGITVVNTVLSDILISAQSEAYTYSLSTPATSNVQMEVDNIAEARMVISATKSTGTITWTRDNADVSIDTNPTSALIEVESPLAGGANVQNVTVTGTLRDGSSRIIEALFTPLITLDAATTQLKILGDNVSVNSDQRTASATGVYESTAAVGSHSLVFPPVKQSGQDLALTQDSDKKITIVSAATQSSKSGTYRITARVDYKGIVKTTTKDVTVSVSALAPTLTATKFPATWQTVASWNSFGGIGLPGTGGGNFFIQNRLEDIVVESDYPGTINVDYEIRRVTNSVGKNHTLTGPFYNQAANTNAAPEGFPASSNKRRDRVVIDPFLDFGLFNYDFTYELYDKPGGKFLRDLRVSTSIEVPKPGATVTLTQDNITSKTYTFTNKSNNGFGYPEPHPLEVNYEQRVDFTATYSSETSITTPRFSFATSSETPGAVLTTATNPVNGQANVTVKSVYYDSSVNFSGTLPTVTQSSGKVNISAQLTTTVDGATYSIGDSVAKSAVFDLPMPPGRCYRLTTFTHENRGPRMYHTRDVYGNRPERLDYSRIPNINGLNGPETKWVGFHSSTNTFVNHTGGYGQLYDPNASTSRPRPLYDQSKVKKRYYSSAAHQTFFNETPGVVIPDGYFMVMSFSGAGGEPYIGQVTLIGSDNNAYALGTSDIWATGLQNDTSRDNDTFHWYIYRFTPPAGVTFEYVFISNIAGTTVTPPPAPDPLTLLPVQPGNVFLGQDVYLNIGTVSGGLIKEDLYVDPGNVAGGSGSGIAVGGTSLFAD